MATAFRIHEDIENVLDAVAQKKDQHHKTNSNIITGKIDQQKLEKQPLRSTFAILNNVNSDNGRTFIAAGNTTHGQKTAFNVMQGKSTVLKTNNENVVPRVNNVKTVTTETYKTFVGALSTVDFAQITDENQPPQNDEVDHANAIITNCSFSDRLPLQEIKQDVETPVCMQDILSPMSIDKSLIENEANASILTVDDEMIDANTTALSTKSSKRFASKDDLEKFFEVEEYRDDILDYLREAEMRNRPKPLYMRKQQDISHSMRTILVDWLVEVGEEYRLKNETLCLVVSYIDRFLSVMSVVRAKLQLVGTAAMFIAAKYEEIYPPDVGEFVYITDNTYTKKQVLRMEQLILKVLTFDLCVPTTSVFLNAYPIVEDLPKDVKCMAQYLCELSLLEAEPYLQYTPSMISAAAIALARLNFGLPIWSSRLENFTSIQIHKLTDIILHLSESHLAAIKSPQQAIQDKYKSCKYSEVSTRTPLQVDEMILAAAIQQMDSETADIEAADTDKEYN
ncbi:cyclin-A1-like [Contarinia nasturtii]|uniref:cyclin-A1-like n=1 Tax=Contarinia nasturtii TaxID=265458 RepID=UPI0012D41057|nr:cyclin-A1-like [Contarinia nasturtii]XP_031619434.1 cyclin-A1-like [Contarinia nasturtii]XP_031619435.1 cyclin-A1-like [Contarinia nasturtii]XP_031619436.1 cyclin-A1-like [Contarinia nasturtii]